MIKRLVYLIICISIICLSGCNKESSFKIQFIDVGQGDSALVECDGHYMLIDAGVEEMGEKVSDLLNEEDVKKLDILVMSHSHDDHVGGLIKVIPEIEEIGLTLCNVAEDNDSDVFMEVVKKLEDKNASITIPEEDEEYQLGSARIKVIYSSNLNNNDSLVMIVTYKNTSFLFTGDIEQNAQETIIDKYKDNKTDKIDLIKMPHHGACKKNGKETLYRFLSTFKPDYAVISTGPNNLYIYMEDGVLVDLGDKKYKAITKRTDCNGNITVVSDGKTIEISSEK